MFYLGADIFIRQLTHESRAISVLPYYVQKLAEIKRCAGLTSLVKAIDNQRAFIYFLSESGHLAASTLIEWDKSFYRIHVIKVSEPNLRRGFGRLLQMEAAVHVIAKGVFCKSPFYCFTQQGKVAFGFYPLSAMGILEEKLPKAIQNIKLAADVPWKEPACTLPQLF